MKITNKSAILIAGGSGFIGKHLAAKCLTLTPHVTCLGLRNDICDLKGVRNVHADIGSLKGLKRAIARERYEHVFNLSGYVDHAPYFNGGRAVIDSHFIGLMNLIECLDRRNLKSFVTVGSSDEYGKAEAPQKESMRESPISPYAFSKTAATHFIRMLHDSDGFPGVVLRLFLVYGPGQDKRRFLPQVITACLEDKVFKTSKGIQIRDLCYIDDIVDALLAAATSEKAKGRLINIGSGSPVFVKDVVKKVMIMAGGGRPVFGAHPYRDNENMSLYADIGLAGRLFGWKPRTDLDDGLRKTIEHYKKGVSAGRQQ